MTGEPVAALDCGTNSIKLLIGTPPEVVVRDSRVVRLGQGVDTTGELAGEALERTFDAIDEFAAVIREHAVPPSRIRFCATSATRDAANARVFMDGVRDRLGVTPEVLSGDEEAALVHAGATRHLDRRSPEPVLVVDIGGGSTELVLGAVGSPEDPDVEAPVEQAVSLDIGSVRLHERHLHDDPPTTAQIHACAADADAALDGSGVDLARARTVVGTSGTIKTLAAGLLDLPAYDRDAVDGATPTVADTQRFTDRLLAMTVAQRIALPYLHPGRADVIGAGALIWSRILARTTVERYVVSEADILYGIAWSIVDR